MILLSEWSLGLILEIQVWICEHSTSSSMLMFATLVKVHKVSHLLQKLYTKLEISIFTLSENSRRKIGLYKMCTLKATYIKGYVQCI